MQEKIVQPAVLIGGPPHAGKSVLTYSLTRALRQYGIEHYVMRACPDGEGHWSQETPRQVAEAIRDKGVYSDEFVRRVCDNIAQRKLPFLVDLGGLPQGEQFQIFAACTHAILLRHREPASIDWSGTAKEYGLTLLADLISDLNGTATLETRAPVLRGTLACLERGKTVQGEPFDSLVELLISRFRETTINLGANYIAKAPVEPVLNLPQILDSFVPGCLDWIPAMLPHLLATVPAGTPLSAYGRAAHWVYTALALHARPAPFYQFDARLGWLHPLTIQDGSDGHPEIMLEPEKRAEFTVLHCLLQTQNLDYYQLQTLHAPELPADKGLILNGKLPLWLASTLARFYQQKNLPWIAGYYPQIEGAVVVHSRVSEYAIGDIIPVTFSITTTRKV